MRYLVAPVALVASVALTSCSDTTGPTNDLDFQQVTAGDRFTCALTRDGRAWCWGQALFGQLGDDDVNTRTTPSEVAGGHRFSTIAAGSDHVCGVALDSLTYCWGLNDFNELGTGTSFCNGNFRFVVCSRVPIEVSGGRRFDSVSVDGYASCGFASGSGQAYCWGWNSHGQLGFGFPGGQLDVPQPVGGGRTFAALSLDRFHACGLDVTAGLLCWGSNLHGQLGADTLSTPRCDGGSVVGVFCAPQPVTGAPGIAMTQVSAGGSHTCALDGSGHAWCWGSRQNGALGATAALGGATPVAVTGGRAYAVISAGLDHACALSTVGQAWCWGLNAHGQLGVGSVSEFCPAFGSAQGCRSEPVAVTGLPRLTRVSAGAQHTCAVSAEGDVWCWGRGTEGQLGDGGQADSSIPVRVVRPEA